jgi:hypothetical protein
MDALERKKFVVFTGSLVWHCYNVRKFYTSLFCGSFKDVAILGSDWLVFVKGVCRQQLIGVCAKLWGRNTGMHWGSGGWRHVFCSWVIYFPSAVQNYGPLVGFARHTRFHSLAGKNLCQRYPKFLWHVVRYVVAFDRIGTFCKCGMRC